MSTARAPRVLFVSYGGGHIGMVLPVIRELERLLPDADCQLMALTTGHLKARAVRPALGYKDFLHLVDAKAARAWGERLSEGNTSPDVPADETIAYLGINYLDLIAQYGQAGAADIFRMQGRRGFRPTHFMSQVIQALRPDVVVATNSPRSERAALEAAQALGIHSVGMVDLFALNSDPFVSREIKPDWTCVLAEPVRQRLIAAGFPGNRVAVTGNPAFDGLFAPDNVERARLFLLKHNWQELTPILWAGHTEPYSHPSTTVPAGRSLPIEVEQQLRSIVRKNRQLALMVRYHPSDWHAYPRSPDEPRVHFSNTPHEPLHPLVLAAQIVVVQTSTVGLEAAVAGKTVISIENSPASLGGFSLFNMGVSLPCPTLQDLPDMVEHALAYKPVETQRNPYASDGLAAGRVANLLLGILSNQNPIFT